MQPAKTRIEFIGRIIKTMNMKSKLRKISALVAGLALLIGLTSTALANQRDEVVLYLNDPLGSAIAAFDEAGTLCWQESYTPYGSKTVMEDSFISQGCGTIMEERGFTGHTEDFQTNLVYMQQRYYDPTIGRFLSIDPVAPSAHDTRTINRYTYAANNPYKYTDPDGRLFFSVHAHRKDVTLDQALAASSMGNAALKTGAGAAGVAATAVLPGPEDAVIAGTVLLRGASVAKKKFTVPDGSKSPDKPDFVVGTDGTTIPVSQSQMRQGFDEAGFPSQDVISPTSGNLVGQAHTLPGGNIVRTMVPDGRNPRRASFTNGNGGAVSASNGTPIQPPRGLTRAERKQYVRERSHVEQSP